MLIIKSEQRSEKSCFAWLLWQPVFGRKPLG
nr:MAG TPA: hypothetical protein [Caudoviricetes sp.]